LISREDVVNIIGNPLFQHVAQAVVNRGTLSGRSGYEGSRAVKRA
jgi:hypothetical protein